LSINADEQIAGSREFLAGVAEGFYGEPWDDLERQTLFDWMHKWGLNTYLYAPKDDLKQRAIWRELYSRSEVEKLKALIDQCEKKRIRFIYALSPGLDIGYSKGSDLDQLRRKFEQLTGLGCRNFALLFDDIPDGMLAEDRKRFDSFASAQAHVANTVFEWTRKKSPDGRFLFCPTAYCGRMVERKLGGESYLERIGRELLAGIDLCWTGPEIISPEITVDHLRELQKVMRRKPVIWDNLHANDYDGSRFYCGPYSGRATELRENVRGILSNPNNEFPLNYVPLRSLAEFARCHGEWKARDSYLNAMQEWAAHFETIGAAISFEELVLLGDCYYLPHEEGETAEAFYQSARRLIQSDSGDSLGEFIRQANRLKEICTRMAELRDRRLFYALSRRVWELREELDLLIGYIRARFERGGAAAGWRSDSHLAGTYRGGMAARLQKLLEQHADGTFVSAETTKEGIIR
jgi:protein O-GlcNAcase/histone acetyltransferase